MSWGDEYVKVETLLGRTLAKVERLDNDEVMIFTLNTGERFRMYHSQDCCESVRVEEIVGDLADLIGSPLTMAEESTNRDETPEGVKPPDFADSYTWTFYRFATVKGYVTIRWLGESNGYYGEEVDFVKHEPVGVEA